MAGSFGVFHEQGEVHVKVRFSAEVARYVGEKLWHPSQRLTAQPDGSLLAEFDLDGTEELKRWILSFGRHAEVLEPGELRGEMVEELASARQFYAGMGKDAFAREQGSRIEPQDAKQGSRLRDV